MKIYSSAIHTRRRTEKYLLAMLFTLTSWRGFPTRAFFSCRLL